MNPSSMTFLSASATHQGKVRNLNEDTCVLAPAVGLWAVADGAGGYGGGDVAAGMVKAALETIGPQATESRLMLACEAVLAVANDRLWAMQAAREGRPIAATVAILITFGRRFACVWSGDSRVYRLRAGGIEQLTRDHSEMAELIEAGLITPEQARTWHRRNVVTRAIGARALPELDHVDGDIADGDQFLLCSDGLTGHVEDAEIAEIAGRGTPAQVCDDLVDLTLARGAKDNVTVVLVRAKFDEATYIRLDTLESDQRDARR